MNSHAWILRKFRANFSSFEEIWLFIRIFLLIILLPAMLRLFSLPMLMKMLTPRDLRVCNDQDSESRDKIVKFADYLLNRNFWIFRSTCLKRSLVLYHFLRKLGINLHVCFGVKYNGKLPDRKTQKKLEGHAWLFYNGNIFLERNAEVTKTYKLTYFFPDIMEQVG
ncbi:MAG: lasso peptide biosynthesis B2 protein [Deltaproteobacteria bacterium]|nr:lasso peptide biosynthesis B2 protein [Deltaproteobacteria bacterium]